MDGFGTDWRTLDAQEALPEGEEEPLRGITVLLVEDEDDVREVTREFLESLGMGVIEAVDGAEALEILSARSPEIGCVLSDILMPRMDGWEMLAALRSSSPALPVLLMSGCGAFAAPEPPGLAYSFLCKPFGRAALRSALLGTIRPVPLARGA